MEQGDGFARLQAQHLDVARAPTDAPTTAAVPRTLDAFLALVARLR